MLYEESGPQKQTQKEEEEEEEEEEAAGAAAQAQASTDLHKFSSFWPFPKAPSKLHLACCPPSWMPR